jgi:DNA polymerase-3 subunit beta
MHFAIQKDALVRALRDCSNAIATRVVQPILSNVLIEAVDDVTLRFSATDLDLAIQSRSTGVVYRPGKVTLPGKKLLEVVSKLPNELVSFQVNQDNYETTVTCKRSKFNLSGLPAEDFPKIVDSKLEEGILMPADVLRRAISQTAFAAASYDASSILGGVYLLLEEGTFEATATDASRLAHRRDALSINTPAGKRVDGDKEVEHVAATATLEKPLSFKAIVPARACSELMKLVDNSTDSEVRIAIVSGQITFETYSHFLSSRLVSGEYPRYHELFPAGYTHLATFDRQTILEAIERVAVMSDERTHLVSLHFEGETLQVSSNTPDLGRAQDEIAMRYEGEPLDISVNVRYIVDVLQRMGAEEVRLEMTGALKPLIFKQAGDDNYRYLLMPVQAKNR